MHQKSLFGDQISKTIPGRGARPPPNPLTSPKFAVSRIDAVIGDVPQTLLASAGEFWYCLFIFYSFDPESILVFVEQLP